MCREFKCLWLADEEVPDWVKPDQVGVLAYTDPSRTYLVIAEAGSAVSTQYRAWAKMYADQHDLKILG